MFLLNSVVTKKRKVGFHLPEELADVFDAFAMPYGSKKKWLPISAAILMFMEANEDAVTAYITRVGGAEASGKLAKELRLVLSRYGAIAKDSEDESRPISLTNEDRVAAGNETGEAKGRGKKSHPARPK